jgi:hypothetical protein
MCVRFPIQSRHTNAIGDTISRMNMESTIDAYALANMERQRELEMVMHRKNRTSVRNRLNALL